MAPGAPAAPSRRTPRWCSTWSCSTSSSHRAGASALRARTPAPTRSRQPAAGDPIEVEIESLDASGDGVARLGGRRVSVPYTIPGERVRIQFTRPSREGHDLRAALVEVVRASPHRVQPRCRHFGPGQPGLSRPATAEPCGGCSWQHIAYPEQLRLKTALVDALVQEAVPGAPAARDMLPPPTTGTPWGYRHKAHFVFGPSQARTPSREPWGLVMGHFARGSRRVVPVTECPVHADAGNTWAFALRDAYRTSGAGGPDRGRRGAAPVLKGITVRVARHTGARMATLVVTEDTDKRLRSATRRVIEGEDARSSFHVNLHPRDDGYIFGRETRRITGPERLREDVAGVSFLISPTAFFQTNVDAAERLVGLVRDAVPPGAAVVDLYAGAGLFALPLAKAGHVVLAVEENREAVADGEASRRLSGIGADRCRWIASRVEDALDRLPAAEVVVLDPPRDGCSRAVLQAVFGARRPALVIYVSCNPETLARDLGVAARLGYTVASLQPVDMFPHTAHVETVAVLRGPRRHA